MHRKQRDSLNHGELVRRNNVDAAADIQVPSRQNWQYTTADGTLRAYEGSTAFYIVNLASGEEACMGDGVDRFYDEEQGWLWPGTEQFYRAFESDLEHAASEYQVAYFNA